ncbi:MAG: hypothetical protein P8X74_17005 [Reinekea sp.]|jgi:hypothetical protein
MLDFKNLVTKILVVALLSIVSCYGFSNDFIELHYDHYAFEAPANPVAIGSYGEPNTLTLFYELSDDYSSSNKKLSIRSVDEDELIIALESQPNCSFRLLLNDVYNNKYESGCSQEYRDTYNKLLKGKDHGTWPGTEVSLYYEIKDSRITVNLISDEHPDIMIQTTKMTKEEVKAILSNYIAE